MGHEQGELHAGAHTRAHNAARGATHELASWQCDDAAERFHVYALEWEPTRSVIESFER